MADRKINTGLTETEIRTAFSRALNDMTDAEIRALVSEETVSRQQTDAQLHNALAAETTARQTADTAIQSDAAKQLNALTAQINGGAKNRMPVESGTASSSVSWFQANGLSIPAGQYIVFFRNMESDDTDAATCRGIFFDATGGNASSYFQIPRGQDVFVEVTINTDAKSLRINQSDTVGHSAGDTMSFSGAMICRKSDWDISHDFVPYCPTMPELYQMILSLNGGC